MLTIYIGYDIRFGEKMETDLSTLGIIIIRRMISEKTLNLTSPFAWQTCYLGELTEQREQR